MRCPSCEKFVSMETGEPEVDGLEVTDEGLVSCSVRIVRCCTECGDELKEANLELEWDAADAVGDHINKGEETKHELAVEEMGVTEIEEGGGRLLRDAKSYFGAEVKFKITCSCDEKWSHEDSFLDKIAASQMEELT